jgi:hypothetical protein
LLQEDEGQIKTAGGQEGRSEVCQLILQLGELQHVLGQGVLQHIHVAGLSDNNNLNQRRHLYSYLLNGFIFQKKK